MSTVINRQNRLSAASNEASDPQPSEQLQPTPPSLDSAFAAKLQREARKTPAAPAQQPWPLSGTDNTATRSNTQTRSHNKAAHKPTQDTTPNTRAPEVANVSPKARRGGWIYASLGFLAGAAFWHAVGFWTFVEEAVFSGPRQQTNFTAIEQRPASPTGTIFDEAAYGTSQAARNTGASKISTGSISPVRPVKLPAKASRAAETTAQSATAPANGSARYSDTLSPQDIAIQPPAPAGVTDTEQANTWSWTTNVKTSE
ncbi:MAG: hypothetical protein RIC14_11815 [Filomicrobium sp.]